MMPFVVQSTTLTTVTYDADRQLLQIEFRNRAIYQYFDVPAGVHQGLIGASSKGRYFNRSIRGRFAYARVKPPSLS